MRSAAHFRGHPIHPALIPFPFAFLTAAFAFDIVGRATGHASWWAAAGYLAVAGIATALLAAVPGLIDYLRTVPPKSSGKRRATLHMVLNLSAVTIFIVATWLRSRSVAPDTSVLVLEGLAVAVLFAGGWLGGVLVSRNQISVDHRYAGAGKWKEEKIKLKADQPVIVAEKDDLKVNQMKLLHVNGQRIVLGRTQEGYVAFDDRCTHRGGSLAGGVMIGGIVQCPWHGSQFDCSTGGVKAGPAEAPIGTYGVSERQGKIILTLSAKS
jgi:uncharacterized membrane protein/nitrite reductase/ring-hydroxylating ferredoxin subunit